MAVKFNEKTAAKGKDKAPAKTATKAKTPKGAEALEHIASDADAAKFVDLYCKLAPKVAALMKDPMIEQLAGIQAKLMEIANDRPADQEVTLMGTKGNGLHFGERAIKRTISDLELVKKFMGQKTFMDVATVGLKAVDDYLTPEQREQVLTVEQTGGRKMRVIER